MIVGEISYIDLIYGNTCPNFTIIPACYIALLYFILLLIFQISKRTELAFLILAGFALTISIYTSIGHILGAFQCPISNLDVPTCYIVFTLFLLLLALKILQINHRKQT